MEYARESSSACEGRVGAFAYLLHDELLGLTEQLAREHNHGRGAVSDLSNDREWSERPGVRDQNFGSVRINSSLADPVPTTKTPTSSSCTLLMSIKTLAAGLST